MTTDYQHWQYTGDVSPEDYGGKWYREIAHRVYQVIELTNMGEACGRDNEGHPTYVVELSLVDLGVLTPKQIDDAYRSCGWELPESMTQGERDAATAIMCFEYGCKAPLDSWEGNNYGKLLRTARSQAHALKRDADAMSERMERPVNKIGSTAREYMTGDITSAVLRGVANNDPAAMIMLKMGVK